MPEVTAAIIDAEILIAEMAGLLAIASTIDDDEHEPHRKALTESTARLCGMFGIPRDAVIREVNNIMRTAREQAAAQWN